MREAGNLNAKPPGRQGPAGAAGEGRGQPDPMAASRKESKIIHKNTKKHLRNILYMLYREAFLNHYLPNPMKKSSSKSTQFKLELNGLVLPKADQKRIADALTKTFKSEVAKTDLAKAAGGGKKAGRKVGLSMPIRSGVSAQNHPGWQGYILYLRELAALEASVAAKATAV
jgi:ribosomal protein L23